MNILFKIVFETKADTLDMFTSKRFEKSHKLTLGYTLFLHLTELKIRKKSIAPCLPLIKSKLLVTDTLISHTKEQQNFTDLEAFKQEQIFRQRLRLSMLRILRQSRSGLSNKKGVVVTATAKIETKRSRDDDEEEVSAKRLKPELREITHLD